MTPQDKLSVEEQIEHIMENVWLSDPHHDIYETYSKVVGPAKRQLAQLLIKERIDELRTQRIRFEVPEEELGLNGHPRPASAGRNALKRKELLYLDTKIAHLQSQLKEKENL